MAKQPPARGNPSPLSPSAATPAPGSRLPPAAKLPPMPAHGGEPARPDVQPLPELPPMPAAPTHSATPPAIQIDVSRPACPVKPTGAGMGKPRKSMKSSPVPLFVTAVAGMVLLVLAGGIGAYVVLSQPGDNVTVAKATKKRKPAVHLPKDDLPISPAGRVTTSPHDFSVGSSQPAGGDSPTDSAGEAEPMPEATPSSSSAEIVVDTSPTFSAPPVPAAETPTTTAPTPTQAPATSSSSGPSPPSPTAPSATASAPATAVDDEAQFEQAIVEMYEGDRLLVKKEYPALRKLFADRFARQNAAEIQKGLGDDYQPLMAWFAEHPDIQQELYTAIRPEADKIPAAMQLFNELRKKFPDQIVPYANLAIATSVVWDEERRGIYEYEHHARRCKAQMPANLLDGIENFQYLVSAESVMQGRIQYVPWEFLVYVVNHRTPQPERVWAVQNFVGKRVMFGKCYSDVPYDYEMLNSGSATAKLNNKEYTLANLRTFGGVCAMQADFASRVGKSMGVAAEYVGGESAGGDRHAWVMWVELKQATPTGLVFSLESHGRYRGDKYYVGALNDPQTAQQITDRDMELRLQTVGLDTIACRQTALVMRAYPMLCEKAQLDTSKKLDLLAKAINASPGCEAAWLATAKLFAENSGEKAHAKQFQAVVDRLFVTFARVPDFTWKVFGDLAAYQADPKLRIAMYSRLAGLYETAERPDLACEARLTQADLLVAEERPLDAVQALAITVKKFPSEGRYVPKMLDKLELLIKDVPNADRQLVAFYVELLPLIPQKRGDDPSPFAIKMFERAVSVFNNCNQPQLAQAAQVQLDKLKTGDGQNN